MFSILKLTAIPLISLFILILGNGLLTTLLALRLHMEGQGSLMIGAMTGLYYAGLVVASFGIERAIIRVGHIRAFSGFASALTVVTLLQGIFIDPSLWLVLRFISGFATAGLFIVIESWLLLLGTTQNRGQVLAIYMLTIYAGQALGQFLINLSSPHSLTLFALAAILSSLAVIPIAMANIGQPKFEEPSTLKFKSLYQQSASGILGCLSSGLILGSIYGLLPLYLSQQTGKTSLVALFMALVIAGGMALQYPIGRLSDIIERRLVLIGVAIMTTIMSFVLMYGINIYWLAVTAIFLFGGLTFTIYPISISHTCDSLASKDIVAGTQALLLAYSVGATAGPFIAPLFMRSFGPNGFFIYNILVSVLLTGFLVWRRTRVGPKVQEEPFIPLMQTTPITAELDPRGEDAR